jgi:hypothetical protein
LPLSGLFDVSRKARPGHGEKSDLAFQQVAKIRGVEQAFRIAGIAVFLERIYGCMARLNPLPGDEA